MQAERLVPVLGAWRGTGPAYRDLATAIARLVSDGRLPPAGRLPAERELAAALGVSRTTVSAAYEHLRSAGYLASRRGSGSVLRLPAGEPGQPWTLRRVEDGRLDLAVAALPPPPALGEHAALAAADLARDTSTGYDAAGRPELRAAIAEHLTGRGLPTGTGEVVVTAGAQHAFTLLLRLLVRPGDRVVVECPTYPNTLAAIIAAGARPVPVSLGGDGWDGDLLADTLRDSAAVAAFLIPDFQNPTGLVMPAAVRAQVVAAARRTGAVIVTDESTVELPLDDRSLPPGLGTYDPAVITIGSMSKPYWGGLRIGWIRAAAPTIHRLVDVRALLDMSEPVFEQLLAMRLLAAAGEIVPAQRALLRRRLDVLAAALGRRLPDWRFARPVGGMTLWADLGAPVAPALASAADARGVAVVPGPRFGSAGAMERFVRLPYTLPEDDLVEAVRRLALAAEHLDPAASPRGHRVA